MPRFYLSNIRKGWPVERQEAALDAAAPGWRKATVYRDVLPPRKRQSHGPADLIERASMLRPTRRRSNDTVTVAGVAPLAWTLPDFLAVLTALAARGDTLTDLDSGLSVPPDATASVIQQAADTFERAIRRVGSYGKTGGQVSGERRSEVAKTACERIAERWKLPSEDYPTAALLAEAGVSRPTAIQYLGPRQRAQWEHQRSTETAARNRARRRKTDG